MGILFDEAEDVWYSSWSYSVKDGKKYENIRRNVNREIILILGDFYFIIIYFIARKDLWMKNNGRIIE